MVTHVVSMGSSQCIRFPTVSDINTEKCGILSEILGFERVCQEDLSDVESTESDNEVEDPTYSENEEDGDEPVRIHRDYDVVEYDSRVASRVFTFLGGEYGGCGVRPGPGTEIKKEKECNKKRKRVKKGQDTFVYRDLELF